jgi:hypothetical protein
MSNPEQKAKCTSLSSNLQAWKKPSGLQGAGSAPVEIVRKNLHLKRGASLA